MALVIVKLCQRFTNGTTSFIVSDCLQPLIDEKAAQNRYIRVEGILLLLGLVVWVKLWGTVIKITNVTPI